MTLLLHNEARGVRFPVVDDQVRDIKENLIIASKILINRKICEAFGHVSARIPDTEHFIITPKSSIAFVNDPDDLVTVNLKGERVEGKNKQPLETWLHTCIYRNRPDVGGIARTHSFTTSAFSIMGQGVKPVHDFGAILLREVPVFMDSRLIENEEIGKKLADFIGSDGTGALLRGNGTAVLGKDIKEATIRAVYLEESAMLQHKALQVGEAIYYSPDEAWERGSQLLESSHLERAWAHYQYEAGLD